MSIEVFDMLKAKHERYCKESDLKKLSYGDLMQVCFDLQIRRDVFYEGTCTDA